MKSFLQQLMETHNQTASKEVDPVYLERPAKLLNLFRKYSITSVFDSGCKDLHWMRYLDYSNFNIKYIGGEISEFMIDICKKVLPNVNVIWHDCTVDPFPTVDLLFSSDVMIHLNNKDRVFFLKNFCSSKIKYLLMTDSIQDDPNVDICYREDFQEYPMSHVTWYKEPWNFPIALDYVDDHPGDQRLKLWSRVQLQPIVENL